MNNPKISVVMPVFNGEKYLNEAINSILNQTYTNFEFIILNDDSTDKTEEIILSYNDPRIVYVKNEKNLQIVKTLNKGIELAKGDYIARMDADDISLPKRFEKQLHFMENNPSISICGTWVQTFGASKGLWKNPLSHEEIKIFLLFNSPLSHPSVLIRKDFFKKFKYEEKYNKAEDYALWVLSVEEHKFSNIPYPLVKYRIHTEQTDTEKQIAIANKIRQISLKKLGCNLSHDEIQMYLKITTKQYVPLHHVESIFNKLLESNKKSNFLDQNLFEKFLSLIFLRFIGIHTDNCFQVFVKFHKSSMHKLLPFSPLIYIKILIKCLIRHLRVN